MRKVCRIGWELGLRTDLEGLERSVIDGNGARPGWFELMALASLQSPERGRRPALKDRAVCGRLPQVIPRFDGPLIDIHEAPALSEGSAISDVDGGPAGHTVDLAALGAAHERLVVRHSLEVVEGVDRPLVDVYEPRASIERFATAQVQRGPAGHTV